MIKANKFIRKTLMVAATAANISTLMPQITVDECIRLAKTNYPLYKQQELTDLEEKYDLRKNTMGWLPQLSVNAKASYQSEVVEMPFEIPGYSFDISHCQYGVTADLSQMIWDGGNTRNNRRMTQADAGVERQQLNVTLYNIGERVENLFLSILLLDRQIEQNNILHERLNRKLKEVEAGVESGVAFRTDIDLINVNIMDCRQQEAELDYSRSAYMKMLGILTGKDMRHEKLLEPDIDNCGKVREIKRPELALYEAQLVQNDIQREGIKTRLSPRLDLTLQAGAGRPGLNMLGNEMQPYYVAGIRMQWDIGQIYTMKSDKKKIELRKRDIEYERETFLMDTSMDIAEQKGVIDKLKKAISIDNDIIAMRERIRATGEEQYRNGTIKMTDLMTMMDDEHNARLVKSLHEIQLIMAVRKLDNIMGKQ